MAYVYLATDNDNIPICVADNLKKFEALLFEYYGLPGATDVEYLGFTQFDNCGYPEVYEGYYEFKVNELYKDSKVVEKIHRHCLTLNELR